MCSLSQVFRIEVFNEYLSSLSSCINYLVSVSNYHEYLGHGGDF